MDLEQKSIERIKMASEMSLHHYGKPLICTYSGGKDSDVMLELFKRSGVPFEVSHGLTTVDAPPTVQHIKETFARLEEAGITATIHHPKMTMWQLIPHKKMPPCRMQRYCCEEYKENVNPNRFVATGVRWAESNKRKKRQDIEPGRKKSAEKILLMSENDRKRALIETCKIKGDMIVNPIIDWPDSDIWEYYWNECPSHNDLYKMGVLPRGLHWVPDSWEAPIQGIRRLPHVPASLYKSVREDAGGDPRGGKRDTMEERRRCIPLVDGRHQRRRADINVWRYRIEK